MLKSLKKLKVTSNHKILLVALGVIILILAFSYFHLGKKIEGMEGAAEIELEQITTSGPSYVDSVNFSNDGTLLAYGSVSDYKAYIINSEDGSTMKSFKHDGPVRDVLITPNKKYFIVYGNNKLNILDLNTGGKLISKHSTTITCMAVDPSSSYLVVGTGHGKVICYDLNKSLNDGSLKEIWSRTYGKYRNDKYIDSLAITDDSDSVIVCSKDKHMRVLNLTSGNLKCQYKLWGRVTTVGINPIRDNDGNIIFAIAVQQKWAKRNNLILYKLDVNTNKCQRLKTITHKTYRHMTGIKFLNNKYLVTGGYDSNLSFYNISTGKIVKNVKMGSDNWILSLDLSIDNKLALGHYKTKLGLYNITLASDFESGSRSGLGSGRGSGGGSPDNLYEITQPE